MQLCKDCIIKSKAVEVLEPEQLNILQDNCAEITFQSGEKIIKEGLLSSHVAYLKSGLAKICKKGVKDIDQILKIVQPGSYMGLQTILFEKIHQFSVVALEECDVCFIDNRSFKELINRNAKFGYELIVYLCKDELIYFNRFVNIHQKQINGRLAEAILYFADEIKKSNDFFMPLARNDIAALVCSTRESVTRAIKDLTEIGTIEVTGKHFKILNYDLLKTISEKG
ncbi:MAG: Crp/Fnr family transcriptional regulator [Chlorobi bacterium]|nr:Crp/Fnr family transcriptional regulator [Chlorobiota bacterium]